MRQVASCSREDLHIEISFQDGERGRLPFLWLRDNCRCDDCYDFTAIARKYAPLDLKIDLEPTKAWIEDGKVNITWTDGHHSSYDNEWLYQKGLSSRARPPYRRLFQLEKEIQPVLPNPDTFDYNAMTEKDEVLYEWLRTVETKGIAIVKDSSTEPGAGPKLLEKIAFTKITQFGLTCTVRAESTYPYPSHTPRALGIHTDMGYLENPPGIVCIHFLKQAKGPGGESLIVDGFFIADLIKNNHPKEYEMLTSPCTYFYDRANPKHDTTSNKHKINKTPIIKLDQNGEVIKITFINEKRDAAVDLPPEKMAAYYKAITLFNTLIYKHAKEIKMEEGDIVTLDNYRMMHGRKAYSEKSERHLEISYLDWDEAKSRRRCLEEKLKRNI